MMSEVRQPQPAGLLPPTQELSVPTRMRITGSLALALAVISINSGQASTAERPEWPEPPAASVVEAGCVEPSASDLHAIDFELTQPIESENPDAFLDYLGFYPPQEEIEPAHDQPDAFSREFYGVTTWKTAYDHALGTNPEDHQEQEIHAAFGRMQELIKKTHGLELALNAETIVVTGQGVEPPGGWARAEPADLDDVSLSTVWDLEDMLGDIPTELFSETAPHVKRIVLYTSSIDKDGNENAPGGFVNGDGTLYLKISEVGHAFAHELGHEIARYMCGGKKDAAFRNLNQGFLYNTTPKLKAEPPAKPASEFMSEEEYSQKYRDEIDELLDVNDELGEPLPYAEVLDIIADRHPEDTASVVAPTEYAEESEAEDKADLYKEIIAADTPWEELIVPEKPVSAKVRYLLAQLHKKVPNVARYLIHSGIDTDEVAALRPQNNYSVQAEFSRKN